MKTYDDWLKDYYPMPANDPEALAKPITHSLRKWRGMQPEVLKEHGMKANLCQLETDKTGTFLLAVSAVWRRASQPVLVQRQRQDAV